MYILPIGALARLGAIFNTGHWWFHFLGQKTATAPLSTKWLLVVEAHKKKMNIM